MGDIFCLRGGRISRPSRYLGEKDILMLLQVDALHEENRDHLEAR